MRKIFMLFLLLFLLLCTAFSSYAGTFTVGAAGYWEQLPYKGIDYNITPLPVLKAKYGRFYLDFPTAGFRIADGDNYIAAVMVEYASLALKSNKSDNDAVKKLDDRDSALYGGVQIFGWSDYGALKFDASYDMLGSNSFRGTLAYLLKFDVKMVSIVPEAGVMWFNSGHNRYYFGVDSKETIITGFESYKPSDSFVPYLSLAAIITITDNIEAVSMYKIQFMPSEVKDSPLTDKEHLGSFYVGIGYKF